MFVSQEHQGAARQERWVGPKPEVAPSLEDRTRAISWLRGQLEWEEVLGRLRRHAGVELPQEKTRDGRPPHSAPPVAA